MVKKKRKRRNMAAKVLPRRTLVQRLKSMSLTQIILSLAGILIALGTIMNGTGAVMDYTYRMWVSGPAPYAARREVEDAVRVSAKDLADMAAATAAQNAQTTIQITSLTARTEESAQRGAKVASVLQSLQLSTLKTKLAEARADSEAHPENVAARTLMLTYQQQLDELEMMAMPP